MKTIFFVLGVASSIACSAKAQDKATFVFEVVGGPVSPHNPSVTVKIFASFPNEYEAFGATTLDLVSTDSAGNFEGMLKPTGIGALPSGSGCSSWGAGTPTPAGGVEELWAFQFNAVGCLASTWNPIHIWSAVWTTDDFTPRDVELSSANVKTFSVYDNPNSSFPDLELYPNSFQHSSTTIQVVPAPGTFAFLAVTGFVMRRRR